MTELDLQKQIIAGLRALGYVVLSTSSAAAGRPRRFDNHSSRGIPDLLVSKEGWGCLLGIEIKGAKTAVSPEQKELEDKGILSICRSWEDALQTVADFEHKHELRPVGGSVK